MVSKLQSPIADREIIGSGKTVSPPTTEDKNTKYFKRRGFEIIECSANELPSLSNNHSNVAFRIMDNSVLNGTIRSSKTNGFYTAHDNDDTIPLGKHFDGGADLFRFEDDSEGSEVRNITVSAEKDGRGVKLLNTTRGCTVRNITVHGELDSEGEWGSGGAYTIVPRGEKVVVRNLNVPDGASRNDGVGSTHDSIGMLLDGRSNGVLEVHNSTIGGHPNNGLYASGCRKHGNDGYVKVYNSTFYNSDRDQIRIGNESLVRGCTLYSDTKKDGFNNLRGLWCRFTRGARVEDTTIKTHSSDHGSAIRLDSNAGRIDVDDCDIELRSSDSRSRGIVAFSPYGSIPDPTIHVKNTRFYGDAPTKDVILLKEGRSGSTLDVDIDCPNAVEEIDVR